MHPDGHRLGHVDRAQVAERGRGRVLGLELEPRPELLAQRRELLRLAVGREDGQGLPPVPEVRLAHQLPELGVDDRRHDVEVRALRGLLLKVPAPGRLPELGPAARGQEESVRVLAPLEAALHRRREVAHQQRLLHHLAFGRQARRPRRRPGRSGLRCRGLGGFGRLGGTRVAVRVAVAVARRRRGRRALCFLGPKKVLGRLSGRRLSNPRFVAGRLGGRGLLLGLGGLDLLRDLLRVEAELEKELRPGRVLEHELDKAPHRGLVHPREPPRRRRLGLGLGGLGLA
mmetsp:Transcript_36202/g.81354  ORF Transcript_36202/g.81354 Transcript_36202/m.81354 type:complete len:286 (+) Transcript_36202:1140-1997(+)